MSANRGKKQPPKQAKQPASAQRRASTQVQPISPVGLILSIVAALVIAGILLFVINSRINAARPAPSPSAPAAVAPTAADASSSQSSGLTQLGGFAKGSAQAKVTVTEFSDFK